MCMGRSPSNATGKGGLFTTPTPPPPSPVAPQIPGTQNTPAATPNSVFGADPTRPKAGDRRSRENARYADKENPNLRRGDAGGIIM